MFEKLPVPSKGDKLRASWGAGVTNRVNELGAMAPAGMLSRVGPTGTGFAPLPANLRDRRVTTEPDRSCFRIESRSVEVEGGEDDETETHRFIVDCYYNVGGKTVAVEDIDIEDLIPHPDDETDEGGDNENDEPVLTVLYFNVMSDFSAEVGTCTFDELEAIQDYAGNYAFPLYLFDESGKILTDLRTAPQLQMFEGGLI